MNLPDVNGKSSEELYQAVRTLSARDFASFKRLLAGPVRRQRVLLDCPESDFLFRPWLDPVRPGESADHILVPRKPDTTPVAHMVESLLAELSEA